MRRVLGSAGLRLSRCPDASGPASAAVERRKASAPEARTNGNIRSCGARRAPPGTANKVRAFWRSASLYFWEAVGRAFLSVKQNSDAKAHRENEIAFSSAPAVAGREEKRTHAQKIPRPNGLYAMAAHAVSKQASAVRIVAQHQSLPLLARLRRRTLPPRALLSGSRMLLAAAAKTAEHRRGVAGAQKGRVWTWLLREGSSKGSEGRKPY